MQSYHRYFNILCDLAMGVWKWHNLPMSVDQRAIEYTLLKNGCAVYFNDEVMGNLCLPMSQGGNFDVYGYPVIRRAYSNYNNYQAFLNKDNSVIIWNNNMRTNTMYAIHQYASRLYEYDRIIDINIKVQKTPLLIKCSESQRLTLINLYKEYDGNSPAIFADKALDIGTLSSLKTDAPYVADRIYYIKQQIWNEALTYLGIRNVNESKRERMVTSEAILGNMDAVYNQSTKLACRQWAVDQINAMFGTHISVEFIGNQVIGQVAPTEYEQFATLTEEDTGGESNE